MNLIQVYSLPGTHSADELCAIWKQNLVKDYKFVVKQKNQSGQHDLFVNFCANQGIGKAIVFYMHLQLSQQPGLIDFVKSPLSDSVFCTSTGAKEKTSGGQTPSLASSSRSQKSHEKILTTLQENVAFQRERMDQLRKDNAAKQSALEMRMELAKEAEEHRRREVERKTKRDDDEWIDNKRAKLVSRIQKQQDRILDLELKRASNEKYETALTFVE